MLIYDFEQRGDLPLYEYLYQCIRDDILSGRIRPDAKLPSKRELAADNHVSVRTVMNAYDQLLTEGYITSEEKRGYFAARIDTGRQTPSAPADTMPQPDPVYREESWFADFTSNTAIYEMFPFSLWRKTMRRVLSELDIELVQRAHFLGVPLLRETIADYLYRSRGMRVSPEHIVIGPCIEFLYGKLIMLLQENSMYGAENPGYKKIPRIYRDFGLNWHSIGMDEDGIRMRDIEKCHANVVHVSPEHHYPLGTVMSIGRRQELLDWAAAKPDRYIIEDDYDCEFRYKTRSIAALQSMDLNHRVIYMNTFSKTLAPSIRISYMVLPEKLMTRYVETTNFYSNATSVCEQYALAYFIQEGYFERHVSRLKKYYQEEGERLIRIIKQDPLMPSKHIIGGESGTHLLVPVDTPLTDVEIKWAAKNRGINLNCLSEFCSAVDPRYDNILVLNYCSLDEKTLRETVHRLGGIFVEW